LLESGACPFVGCGAARQHRRRDRLADQAHFSRHFKKAHGLPPGGADGGSALMGARANIAVARRRCQF
jgi:hypothetical protein